ncbi:MAG: peptide ABC transporter substrate-binding protein [Gammaproteobacteria bacterium]|nr:peptide ABC transporter substrate-binding protein [Gammaproteobacteria bacterium]
MSTTQVATEESFSRSAGKQLAVYALAAVALLALLMWLLNLLASLTASAAGSSTAVDAANNTITIRLSEEPPQLDTTLLTDSVSGVVIAHVMEGLLRYDQHQRLVPGMAERWEINAEQAVFNLRDALWSDGEPVTAHDFVFAWRTALDPVNASEYAFILYPIRNAEAINRGELPLDALGARAEGDRTLVVDLERPVAFFDKLTAFSTYYPVRQDFYEATGGRYGADADQLLYNGPFTMESWVHGQSLDLRKNPRYWDRERIRLDRINVAYIVSDANAVLNLFKDGKISLASLTAENLAEAMEQRWHINRFMDGSVFFIEFNHRPDRLTRNRNLRKAMLLAQDPNELVYKVIKIPGYLPGESLFPVFLDGVRGKFREEYPAPEHRMDIARARQHLEKARVELGLDEFPPLVMLTGDNPVSNIQSEYFQAVFKKNLGLEIRIDRQIFKQRLDKMTKGQFDMVLAGWGPDYNDALTYGDLFASWNLNNRGRYANPEYDRLVGVAQGSLDAKVRMDAFDAMQRIIYEDAVLIVNYERGQAYVTDPRVKGIVRRAVGAEQDYTYAYIDMDG